MFVCRDLHISPAPISSNGHDVCPCCSARSIYSVLRDDGQYADVQFISADTAERATRAHDHSVELQRACPDLLFSLVPDQQGHGFTNEQGYSLRVKRRDAAARPRL